MPTGGFETFGGPHLVVLAITFALPILLASIARRTASAALADGLGYALAGILLVNEVTHWGIRLAELGVRGFVQNHLPLQVCGVATLLTAAVLVVRNQKMYEIAYFWGLVGTSNAVITPSVEAGFPDYRFFQYFTAHSGIVVGVLYATLGLRMRPTLAGLWRAFIAVNVFAVAVGAINVALDSNYMFLCEPPPDTASPFFFAPWPWYIPIIDAIALALFFAVLSPFLVSGWSAARRAA